MDREDQTLQSSGLRNASTVFLRIALAAAFLSAVADRFGVWGPPGKGAVAWGNFSNFEAYTGVLNWFLPHAWIPLLAWVDTALETPFGLLLLVGLATRATSYLSGILLLLFALAMSFSTGLESALSYSVFSASAGAFLLASCGPYPYSLDHLQESRNARA
ncbi:MAG TPA: DoxX family protein [Candidatus Acidoferrales bacterium]|nr:DoxX family protein [Candidatus Acidoferrales bacterium]